MTFNRPLKIVTLGDTNVGKSALLLRYVKRTFHGDTPATIVDILQTQMNIENKKVDIFLWDTGGQERFKSLISNYFREADGALLVYDVTKVSTFTGLPGWLAHLRAVNERATIIIVGNKIDEIGLKDVSAEAVKKFADWYKLDFIETSAKSGENVDQVFEKLVTRILNSISLTEIATLEHDEDEEDHVYPRNSQHDVTQVSLLQLDLMQEVKDTKKKRCC